MRLPVTIAGLALAGLALAGLALAGLALAGLALLVATGGTAIASTTILGDSFAAECSHAARKAADHAVWDDSALVACTIAVESESMRPHDRAATYVNRGTLLLTQGSFSEAKSDFDTALTIEPTLGEAFADRGAALIAQHDFAAGIADIDRGLALHAEEPEKAYFNRAIADEDLGDPKSAYGDYQRAAELKPSWEAPRKELQRFKVTPVLQ